ncbi:MAG TPA: RluA family pseudouridine synthase [Feifaniaceae bacterium]|nr:RluA family pseudouridine synthase [Feifaniaceae bacterium]
METRYAADTPGERLDIFLSRVSGESRARVQRLIQEEAVLVSGKLRKANYKLQAGEDVLLRTAPPESLDVMPEPIPIDIVYQDADICVVNKPQGMVVHPAPGNESGTLVNALLYAVTDLSGIGGVLRPGIVHRIDKMTSGLLVIAKNDLAHADLSAQIKAHTARRNYLAIVEGNLKEDTGTIDAPIGRHPADRKRMAVVKGGREAVTHWQVLRRMGQFTLVKASLETGRTHQIRVHMAYSKHPVAGDSLYGPATPKLNLDGQALHAYELMLKHPRTGEEMRFFAPPPDWFLQALRRAGCTDAPDWEQLP